MGKKRSKKGGSKVFQGKETFQRLNYLYQAANLVLAQPNLHGDLPAYYGRSLLAVAQKSVLKIEPNVKRDICKGCGCLLKAGITVRTRIRSGILTCTCTYCGTLKRFPCKRGYKHWLETDEACLEEIEVQDCSNDVSTLSDQQAPVSAISKSEMEVEQRSHSHNLNQRSQ